MKGTHDHDRSLSPHFSAGSPWTITPMVVEQSEPDFSLIRDLYEEKCLVGLHVALSQSCLCEAKSEHRISDNQWLARLNFPVFR